MVSPPKDGIPRYDEGWQEACRKAKDKTPSTPPCQRGPSTPATPQGPLILTISKGPSSLVSTSSYVKKKLTTNVGQFLSSVP